MISPRSRQVLEDSVLSRIRHHSSYVDYDLAKIYWKGRRSTVIDAAEHMNAAIQWISRAQDAFPDGGVARSYSLIYHQYFKKKGWLPSYPETTGYLIPTMFDCALFLRRHELADRAIRMADWECDVQMENGAVQGGTIDQTPTPAIFNTGQVIFGWVRAFQETGKERYLESAARAGKYLVDQQDEDGAWRKNLSNFASSGMNFFLYNTRTAWALLELSLCCGNDLFREAAVRNIEFALRQQHENGWFPSNCLNDPSQPLLHTIAYCIRGILEVGVDLGSERFINRAKIAADALIERQNEDGSLPGRFDDRWKPTVSWSCLTGNAQISIIWGRLYQIFGEWKYLKGTENATRYLRSVQLLQTRNPDIYGGISGSYPLHGGYGRFEILNWAVKFFLDALMLEAKIRGKYAT